MAEPKLVSDGNADFSGGMDSYQSPSFLGKNQYYCSVNCQIKPGIEGISTRSGYREIKLNFPSRKHEEIFRSSEIQGNGHYISRDNILIILCSGNGYIFEFKEISTNTFEVKIVGSRNNPYARKMYFSPVPEGNIINDSESSAIYAHNRSYNRVTGNKNITAGRAGIYVQNRFFYIDENGQSIIPSTINNPTSLEERIINNVTGFLSPDDTEIKAIGVQRVISKDTQGGSLTFSTRDNIYSVDVSGPMSSWGPVVSSVFDVAAVSPFSFLSANSNVYFRSRNLGLASLQYLQYIWNNVDTIEVQSRGGHLFFNNDSELFLDNCYSAKCNNFIYTTVSPHLSKYGVYWNGMIVCRPGQKGIIRYDSLYTGIRPWCLQTVKNQSGKESLYVFSKDYDDVNRLYVVDDSIDYDVTIKEPKKEISSIIISRLMDFTNPFVAKKCNNNQMFLSVNGSKLDVVVSSRNNQNISFRKVYEISLKDTKCFIDDDGYKPKVAEEFQKVITYSDKVASDPFIINQQMICLKGSFRLSKLIRTASFDSIDKTITQNTSRDTFSEYIPEKFFTYKLYD